MPELPEVETIRRSLAACLIGRRVVSVRVGRPSVVVGSRTQLVRGVAGREFVGFRRHGKLLILDLSQGSSLLVHLRMTGQLVLPASGGLPPYTRVLFDLDRDGPLVYADCRRLGSVEVWPTTRVDEYPTLARMGPDALSPEAAARLVRELPRRRAPVKLVLLDQSVIAAIGNIYASETLHAARVAPDRPACDLSAGERRALAREVRRILGQAVELGGTTLIDGRYCDPAGTPGRYAERLRAYGREGERCLRRGCGGTVERLVQQNRSTFWCPVCQR